MKTKPLYLLCILALIQINMNAQPELRNYVVTGKLKKFKIMPEKGYMNYKIAGGEQQIDSFTIEKGKIRITGQISEPLIAILHVRYPKNQKIKMNFNVERDATWIVIEPGKTKFKAVDSFSNFSVNRPMHGDFIEKIDKKISLYDKEIERLTEKLIAKHSEGKQDEVAQLRDSIKIKKQEIRNNVYLSFAKANPNSFLSLYALYQSLGYGLDSNVIRDVLSGLNRLTEYVQQYPTAQFLRTTLEAELNVGLGRIAPDFIQEDTVNNAISLSSFRGKYLLLEFWGSWCLPCRAESPNLVKAYNYFHSKGFEILSVSLERKEDKEKWLKAIHDDKLAWTHVTDFKYWSNEVAKKYNVSEVPKNFLIDPKGKIIAKDLRGDALHAKLKEIIGE